jgi:hypothetical protein
MARQRAGLHLPDMSLFLFFVYRVIKNDIFAAGETCATGVKIIFCMFIIIIFDYYRYIKYL